MSAPQKVGIDVLTSQNAALKNPRISVSTTKDTIILNGTVNSEAERKRAVAIVKQKNPKYKVEDHLKVTIVGKAAQATPSNQPAKKLPSKKH